MPVTVRVGAIHLGWDVVSVAAGGGGIPIRPVQVEGEWTPPAYLLADSSGRLHTAGVKRHRPDLGMAIADVRDILGHPQIVIAGATWPAELVFRARMYNPLAAVGQYLRGKPELVALPYPDSWPEQKVELYCVLVEQLDVIVEPLPESIAMSGYVRALGLVRAPDQRNPHGIGATVVYSDGRSMLVVAVHGDEEQPTESVDIPVDAEAMRDARSADNVVIEVMAAARSIGADTSTVLLAGNVRFNDALRLAFQNHLGHRLQVADHPMHALVLGAAHLLVADSDSTGRHAEPELPRQPSPPQADPTRYQAEAAAHLPAPPRTEAVRRHAEAVQYGPGYPTTGRLPEPRSNEDPTARVTREEPSRGLPPGLAELGSRFTRPPGRQADEPMNQAVGRPSALPPAAGRPPPDQLPPPGPRTPYQHPPGVPEQARPGQWQEPASADDEDQPRKGKLWKRMKDNLFGAHTVVGVLALAVAAVPTGGERVELVGSVSELTPVTCPLTPHVTTAPPPRQDTASVRVARVGGPERADSDTAADPECAQPSIDTLRYRVPGPPCAIDPGPPVEI